LAVPGFAFFWVLFSNKENKERNMDLPLDICPAQHGGNLKVLGKKFGGQN